MMKAQEIKRIAKFALFGAGGFGIGGVALEAALGYLEKGETGYA